jgi:hypothetical protein
MHLRLDKPERYCDPSPEAPTGLKESDAKPRMGVPAPQLGIELSVSQGQPPAAIRQLAYEGYRTMQQPPA